MCRCEGAPKQRRVEDSIGERKSDTDSGSNSNNANANPDQDLRRMESTIDALPRESSSPSHSQLTTKEAAASASESTRNLPLHIQDQPPKDKATRTVESILPNAVWLEHIIPCLDRSAWNALMQASKSIHSLVTSTTTAATSTTTSSFSRRMAQPPWPTNRSFQSKVGGQGMAIESISLSHDGEFMACGSVIGTIEIWNLRTGKLEWKKPTPPKTTTTHTRQNATRTAATPRDLFPAYFPNSREMFDDDLAESIAQRPEYFPNSRGSATVQSTDEVQLRRSSPLGSLVKFSPGGGYVLACGFENRVFVWDLERELWLRQQQQHQDEQRQGRRRRNRNASSASSCHQILEINCRQGTIYEVTYLGFSDAFGRDTPASSGDHRLIARYGKYAYIWTAIQEDTNTPNPTSVPVPPSSPALHRYVLTHCVSLTSSRCQMISNPSLTFLAVATNGNKELDGKGIVHVWNLDDKEQPQNQQQQQSSLWQRKPTVSTIRNPSSKIVAYPDHVVRGLEFIRVGETTAGTTCLVSASLQGEIKFWKQQRPQQHHQHRGTGYETADLDALEPPCPSALVHSEKDTPSPSAEEAAFVCIYRFQSPGKIFSLASWSSTEKILLAAGEARGKVRVWKISTASLSSSSSPSRVCECDPMRVPRNSTNAKAADPQERLQECLSAEVGDHVHYDNIKLLAFAPNGKSLAVSRAYDAKIWFQTVWQ